MDGCAGEIAVWEKLSPLLAALFGSLITGGLMLMGQISGQYFEDTRKLRLIAYESAMKEWQMRAKLAFDKGETIPAFGDILLEHIEYSYVIRRYGANLISEDYAGVILDNMLEKYHQQYGLECPPAKDQPAEKTQSPRGEAQQETTHHEGVTSKTEHMPIEP